jgi:hypothetical protein
MRLRVSEFARLGGPLCLCGFLFFYATCTIADDDSLIAKIPATCDGGTTATLVIHATKSTFPSPPGTLVFSRITKLQIERTLP